MLLAAALAVLCACDVERPIRAERFARSAGSDVTGVMAERRSKAHVVRDVCEIGARAYCFGRASSLPPGIGREPTILYKHCMRGPNGRAMWNDAECNTPLVVAFDTAPVEFTRAEATFAIGVSERTEWVSAKTPWVALDRDGSGCIESERELFAGFDALAELDANSDGRIDARDPAFSELVLWSDRDQDKRCAPSELEPLSHRIESLPLAYVKRAWSVTSYEGETAPLPRGARLVDVHLAPLD